MNNLITLTSQRLFWVLITKGHTLLVHVQTHITVGLSYTFDLDDIFEFLTLLMPWCFTEGLALKS